MEEYSELINCKVKLTLVDGSIVEGLLRIAGSSGLRLNDDRETIIVPYTAIKTVVFNG